MMDQSPVARSWFHSITSSARPSGESGGLTAAEYVEMLRDGDADEYVEMARDAGGEVFAELMRKIAA